MVDLPSSLSSVLNRGRNCFVLNISFWPTKVILELYHPMITPFLSLFCLKCKNKMFRKKIILKSADSLASRNWSIDKIDVFWWEEYVRDEVGLFHKVLHVDSRKFWILTTEGRKNKQWVLRLLQVKCSLFCKLAYLIIMLVYGQF